MKTYLNFITDQMKPDIFDGQLQIEINNNEELDMILDVLTEFDIYWASGSMANSYKFKCDSTKYLLYNYFYSKRLNVSKTKKADLPLLSVEDFMKMVKLNRKRKTNREIDPYDEEDWGWIDDD